MKRIFFFNPTSMQRLAHVLTILGTSLFLLHSFAARAQGPACAEAFAGNKILFSGVADPVFQAEVTELVPQLEALLGQTLPVEVKLTNGNFYSDAFYLPTENAVRIGVHLGDRSPAARLGVFAHEFAHGYTRANLRFFVNETWLVESDARAALSQQFREIEATPEFKKVDQELESIKDLIHREMQRKDNPVFDENVRIFKALQEKRVEILQPFIQAQSALNHRIKIARAFSELFSDAVAVVATRNRGVIADALGYAAEGPFINGVPGASERRKNPQGARPRSFEINRFNTWAPESKFGNEYSILDPARGVLWNLYLANLPEQIAPKFFKTFILASEREIQRLFERGADDDLVQSPPAPELNRDFLRTFQEVAKSTGLSLSRSPSKMKP